MPIDPSPDRPAPTLDPASLDARHDVIADRVAAWGDRYAFTAADRELLARAVRLIRAAEIPNP